MAYYSAGDCDVSAVGWAMFMGSVMAMRSMRTMAAMMRMAMMMMMMMIMIRLRDIDLCD